MRELITVTLDELKIFLRVDADIDDTLINALAISSEETVEGVLGFPLSNFGEEIPDIVRQTVCILTARRYENRLGETLHKDGVLARSLLQGYRDKTW